MIKLTQIFEGKEALIAINPKLVQSVAVGIRKGETVITFGEDNFIIVKESFGYVTEKIEKGEDDDQ